MKKLTIFLALTGLALIVALWVILAGAFLPTSTLVLNIVVCSIIFLHASSYTFFDWDRSNDKVGRWVGMLGLSLNSLLIYSIVAIAIIAYCNFLQPDGVPVRFSYQFLMHAVLFFAYLLMLGSMFATGKQVERVYNREQEKKKGVAEMRQAMEQLQDCVSLTDGVNPLIREKLDKIQADLRYVTPCSTAQASGYEEQFIQVANDIKYALSQYKMNEENITQETDLLARVLDKRRNSRI